MQKLQFQKGGIKIIKINKVLLLCVFVTAFVFVVGGAALAAVEEFEKDFSYSLNNLSEHTFSDNSYNEIDYIRNDLFHKDLEIAENANYSYLKQDGNDNNARIIQRAGNNYAQIIQSGNGNQANILQKEAANSASIKQIGNNNLAKISQLSRGNTALIFQSGRFNHAEIIQD